MLCSPNESESVRNILWERQRAAVGWDVVSPNESEPPPRGAPLLLLLLYKTSRQSSSLLYFLTNQNSPLFCLFSINLR